MRKRAIALFLSIALLGGIFTVAATGGASGDPLLSKSYIDGTYTSNAVGQAESQMTKRHDVVYASAEARLRARSDLYAARVHTLTGKGQYYSSFTDVRLKRGDIVSVTAGSGVILLAGTATLSGKAVDLTKGQEVSAGNLTAGSRYVAAEDATVRVTVTSPTAVLSLEGFTGIAYSGEIDYNELAAALKAMGLFKGSDTGYGMGYDLEKQPTRIQGLIMFLRLLGEEEAALATQAASPFSDVPAWSDPYVAYAYEKGYTKGVDSVKKLFGTNDDLTAQDYMTFLLRALGYRDADSNADFAWSSSLSSAKELGVINGAEYTLVTGESFLRAHVVYLSYYALDAKINGKSNTLLTALGNTGTLDAAAVRAIRAAVTAKRLA